VTTAGSSSPRRRPPRVNSVRGDRAEKKKWFSPRFLRVLCVSAFSAALWSCVKPAPLPEIGYVPEFTLVSDTGAPFDSHALDGHIWVADFIYTNCDGPCPMMSTHMRRLQDQTAVEFPDVRFVSFTVDPTRDTPEALAAYAKRYKRDASRWFFLTGETAKLNEVSLNAFKLNSVDGSMSHSTRFALVDRSRHIRGYYVTGEDGFMPKLMHDIRQLERDKS
jgi:protein SCO1